jgi:hypothetical protein
LQGLAGVTVHPMRRIAQSKTRPKAGENREPEKENKKK